ncbi:LytTR family DNA-binding domain-containing protein [Pontivivens insulae]|uniref:HTH LytTR-type domain-containing protein n=1 Tax=Pontivivens insulae TaxID=1639689 RepID=A0A2R8ABF6_9RHOB|nr:LytTR family DNA-binding domain-containing protein [Pontivivens insulae]RED11290.1 LytTR family transcriptional regulator [Pontivivens insulae]SPF29537.1 hypothetical protein POI8812_01849 [Pontivivens insulae]
MSDVNDGHLQFALREMRKHFQKPTVLVGLLGAGVILGLAGPFDTLDTLGTAARLVYWLFVAVVSYATGALLSTYCQSYGQSRGWSAPVLVIVSALVISVPVTAFIFGLNWVVFSFIPQTALGAAIFFGNVLIVSLVVNIMFMLAERSAEGAETPRAPALLERLPPAKRGQLLSISVSDHYVEVVTTKGQEMILMRLSDAMGEAGTGLQIHRSHWVAEDAIRTVSRQGDGAIATLSDGRTLPVSRSRLPDLKAAGWLGGAK